MTHFRKRLDANVINQLNEAIVMEEHTEQHLDNNQDEPYDDDSSSQSSPSENMNGSSDDDSSANQRKLLLVATCTPADIAYPIELGLLNYARKKLESIIDVTHFPHREEKRKPRTYRQKARKSYLSVAKQRKRQPRKRCKAVGKQLGFVEHNLNIVSKLKKP